MTICKVWGFTDTPAVAAEAEFPGHFVRVSVTSFEQQISFLSDTLHVCFSACQFVSVQKMEIAHSQMAGRLLPVLWNHKPLRTGTGAHLQSLGFSAVKGKIKMHLSN